MYPSRVRSVEKSVNGAMDRIAVKLIDSLDLLASLQRNLFDNCERDNKENRRVINQIIRCVDSTQKLVERECERYVRYQFDSDLSCFVKEAIDFSETVLETLYYHDIEYSICLLYEKLLSKFNDSVANLNREHFSTNVFLKQTTAVPYNELEDYYLLPDPPLYTVSIKNGSIFIDKGES